MFAMLKNDDHPFSNKYGATAQAILTEFMTNEDLVNASTEDHIEFINRKSRGRISNPTETASILQTAARTVTRP